MKSDQKIFRTALFEDGTYAVLRANRSRPQTLEVVAIFYDADRAQRYAAQENGQLAAQPGHPPSPSVEPAPPAEDAIAEANGVELKLTERQSAVLDALRVKAGEHSVVEIKAADLAEAANIPLGSVHSVIQSLEKSDASR